MTRTSRAYAALVAGGLCAVLAGCADAEEATGTEPVGTDDSAPAVTAPARDAAAWLSGQLDGRRPRGPVRPATTG